MTRKCTCQTAEPPRGPAGPPPPPPAARNSTYARTQALNAAIEVHRLAAETRQVPLAPVRDLAEDYYRWITTGVWE